MSFDYSKQRPVTAVRRRRPGELIVPNRPERTVTNAAAGWETLGGDVIEGAWFEATVELPDIALDRDRWLLRADVLPVVIQSVVRVSDRRVFFNIDDGTVEPGERGTLVLVQRIPRVIGQEWQWR